MVHTTFPLPSPPDGIRRFFDVLRQAGKVHIVPVAVDPALEVAEIVERVSHAGGDALFFPHLAGGCFPLAANLFGSMERMAWALGLRSLQELAPRLQEFLHPGEDARDLAARSAAHRPVTAEPVWREVAEDPDFLRLPFISSRPLDASAGGRGGYLTLPLLFTRGLAGDVNCGLYRVQRLDSLRTAVACRPTSGAFRHCQFSAQARVALPAALVLGAPPALLAAAAYPLPEGTDDLTFAGILGGGALACARSPVHGFALPAGAEVIVEGFFAPGETALEGPFANHSGYYVPTASAPVFTATHLFRRHDCFIPATVVGPPPMEDCFLAKALERVAAVFVRSRLPWVRDISLPLESIFHGCAIVAVEAGERRAQVEELRRAPELLPARMLVLVDAEVEPADLPDVYWRVVNNVRFDRDIVACDPSHIVIDATVKGERLRADRDAKVARLVTRRWHDYGL